MASQRRANTALNAMMAQMLFRPGLQRGRNYFPAPNSADLERVGNKLSSQFGFSKGPESDVERSAFLRTKRTSLRRKTQLWPTQCLPQRGRSQEQLAWIIGQRNKTEAAVILTRCLILGIHEKTDNPGAVGDPQCLAHRMDHH